MSHLSKSARRFGENDAQLSLEDKMFLRFQKERVKKARNASIFNLDASESSTLTHKGKILSELNMADDEWLSSDDDNDNTLGRDVVNQLHFGGGLNPKNNNTSNISKENNIYLKKDKSDTLQDIIMKSKLIKMEKKEAKDLQENKREEIDKEFDKLVSSSLLDFNPLKRDRSEFNKQNTSNDPFDDYDKILHEMSFDSKAHATNRTKSPEEIALETREKLEELEKERIRRMSSSAHTETTNDEDEEVDATLEEVFSNKKKRRKFERENRKQKNQERTDDDIDGLYERDEDGGEEEGGGEEEEEGYDVDEDDEEEEEEEGSEDESDGDEEGDDEDDNEEEEEEHVSQGKQSSKTHSDKFDANDVDEEYSDEEEEEEEDEDNVVEQIPVKLQKNLKIEPLQHKQTIKESKPLSIKKESKSKNSISSISRVNNNNNNINEQMPHKIECPRDMESYLSLINQYVFTVSDEKELIDRIIAWNNIHLPGEQGKKNKELIHNFLDILMKYFIMKADSLANSIMDEQKNLMALVRLFI